MILTVRVEDDDGMELGVVEMTDDEFWALADTHGMVMVDDEEWKCTGLFYLRENNATLWVTR